MFTKDYRPFRREVLAFLDTYTEIPVSKDRKVIFREMHEGIVKIVKKHFIPISPDQFANNVVKLVAAGNRPRVEKLFDALGDRGLTAFGMVAVFIFRLVVLKLLPLALFVIFVIWAYTRCSG